MASDTAPAAPGPDVPDMPAHAPRPGTPAASDTPARGGLGWLASALQPVDPARTTFDLTPTPGDTTDPNGIDLTALTGPGGGPSSAAYHDGPDGQTDPTSKTGTGGQEKSVVRAWLLAGAERWRKGADARNKALDIKKAQATALQVKEARTVNRSEKIVGGGTSTATSGKTDAGKSNTSKTSNTGSSGPKNGSGSGRNGGSGSGGHGGGSGHGRGTGSGSGAGGGRGSGGSAGAKGNDAGKGSRTNHGNGKGADHTKPPSPSGGSGGKNGTHGPSGSGGSSGRPGKDTASHNGSSSGKSPQPQTTSTCGDASGISMTKDNKPKQPKNTSGDGTAPQKTPRKTPENNTPVTAPAPAPAPGSSGSKGGTGAPGGAGGNGKTPTPKPGSGRPTDTHTKNPDPKGGTKNTPKTDATPRPDLTKKPRTDPTKTPKPSEQQATGPAVRTQTTREAGYRHGTQIGQAVAHAGAYKDGLKDGYHDTAEAAAREKARLDTAHRQHKQTPSTQEQPVPPNPNRTPPPRQKATSSGDLQNIDPRRRPRRTFPPKPTQPPRQPAPSSADYQPPQPQTAGTTRNPATPVPVDRVDATHLWLGNGATRQVISRGEVRTLKQYERALTAKADLMSRIAEGTKALQAHAEEQARKVTNYLEQAKAVKGGANLIAALTTLQDKTNIQSRQAEEIHQRAVRAADNTSALLTNVDTRYSGMYKAVVDSDETSPAELRFYKGN